MLELARPNAPQNLVPRLQITAQHRLVLQGSSFCFTQRYFFSYPLHFTEILLKSPRWLLKSISPPGNQQLLLSACPGMQRSAPQSGPHPAPSGQSRIFSFRGGALRSSSYQGKPPLPAGSSCSWSPKVRAADSRGTATSPSSTEGDRKSVV